MWNYALALAAHTLLCGPPELVSQGSRGGGIVISECRVRSVQDVFVPAREAGALAAVHVKEGDEVKKGQLLAQIDDEDAQNEKYAAELERDAAQAQAASDIEVRFAGASQQVAQAELEQKRETNRKREGVVPASEIRRLELTAFRGGLEIEKSRHDQHIAKLTANVKQAAVKAAESSISRRKIVTPIDGVVSVHQRNADSGGGVFVRAAQVGQWVGAGETVFRVIDMATLRVEGFVRHQDHNPADVAGRPVVVQVELASGRVERFAGQVVHVSPVIEGDNALRVAAEVRNRKDQGQWLLRPEMWAEMTIQPR